jgi:hypothetical protein
MSSNCFVATVDVHGGPDVASSLSPLRILFDHCTVGQFNDPSITNISSYINKGLQIMQGILDCESAHDPKLPSSKPAICFLHSAYSTQSHICSSYYTRFSKICAYTMTDMIIVSPLTKASPQGEVSNVYVWKCGCVWAIGSVPPL